MKQSHGRPKRVTGSRLVAPKKTTKWRRLGGIIAAVGVAAGAVTGVWAAVEKVVGAVTNTVSDPLAVNVFYPASNENKVVVPIGLKVDPYKDGGLGRAILYYANHGGYIPTRAKINIRLTGQRNAPVDVTRVRIVQVTHDSAVNGTYLLGYEEHGLDVSIPLHVDLDNLAPVMDAHKMVAGPTPDADLVDVGPYPGNEGDLILAKDENGLISIDATARKYSVAFKVELDTMVDGKPQTPIIVDTTGVGGRGDFFRITAVCTADGNYLTYWAGYKWSPTTPSVIVKMSASELAHAADPSARC